MGGINWTAVLAFAVSTGFVTAVFNQAIGWLRETAQSSRSTTRDARYLAIRLAVLLEQFAITCADYISDNDLFRQSDGNAGAPHGSVPELPAYPDEPDWKALAPNLLARALTLRNEVSMADGAVAFWADIGERESIPGECDDQCGKIGYVAWSLARDMRGQYRLGEFDPSKRSWDVVELLKTRHDAAHKRRQEAMASS